MAGFVSIRQVESRPNLSFGRTLRLSSAATTSYHHRYNTFKNKHLQGVT